MDKSIKMRRICQGYNYEKKQWCQNINQDLKPILRIEDNAFRVFFEMCQDCLNSWFDNFKQTNHQKEYD